MERWPVRVHGIAWATAHGHPVIIVRGVEHDFWFGIAASPSEAQALADCPCAMSSGHGRLVRLFAAVLNTVGIQLTEVQLDVDRAGCLEAHLLFIGPTSQHTVLAHGLDGVVLATVLGVPMTMTQQSVHLAAQRTRGMPRVSPFSSDRPTMNDGLPPDLQAFLASLDLDPLD